MKINSSLLIVPALLLSAYAQAAERNLTYVLPYTISQPDTTGSPLAISGFLDLTAAGFFGPSQLGDYSITLTSLNPETPIYGTFASLNFNNNNSTLNKTHAAADRWYLSFQDPGNADNLMFLNLNFANLVAWSDPPSPSDNKLVNFNQLLPSYGFLYDFTSANISTSVDQLPGVLGVPEPRDWQLMLLGGSLIGMLGLVRRSSAARRDRLDAA